MGLVFKRGSHYHIRYEGIPNADGSRRQVMRSCRGMNKKQAEALLQKIEYEIRYGTYADHKNISIADFLSKWMEVCSNRLSHLTIKGYQIAIDKHINPRIGGLKITRLKPLHIQELYTNLMTSGLGPKSIKNIHGVLSSGLTQAVKWQILNINPAFAVDLPKRYKPIINPGNYMDYSRLIEALEGSIYKIPVLIAIGTGMRKGEILGLHWEDYDKEKQVLIVRRSMVQLRENQIIEKSTKTEKTRVVKIPGFLAYLLDDYRKTNDTPWICITKENKRMTPASLQNGYYRIRKELGIEVTLHGLRHGQATMLLAAGVPVKVVSERLGHSNVYITQDTYAHVLPHMQDQAVDVLDGIFKR